MARQRQGQLGLSLAFSLLAAGCAGQADNSQGALAALDDDAWVVTDAASSKTTGFADGTPGGINKDIDAMSASANPDGVGAMDGVGVGLKPGGAQNAAVFHAVLAQGEVPMPQQFDLQGWLNEHGTHLPTADPNQPIDLHALAGVKNLGVSGQADVVLQLGFNTGKTLLELQPHLAVVVAVDHSGSMAGPSIEQVRRSVLRVFDTLPPGSSFGLVGFAQTVCPCLELTVVKPELRNEIEEKLEGLEAIGGSDLYGGLEAALIQLDGAPTNSTRVLLLVTDGGPTVGKGPNEILALAQTHAGVHISSVAVGANAATALLAKLAAATQGSWLAAPDPTLLDAAVLGRLHSVLVPLAKDLKVTVDLPAGWMLQMFGFQATKNDGVGEIGAPMPVTDTAGQGTKTDNDGPPLDVLYASQDDGIVLARLTNVNNPSLANIAGLTLATVKWEYRLTKEGSAGPLHTGTRLVQVPGLAQIPDQGLGYFEDVIVRRSYGILHVGEKTLALLTKWHAGDHKGALEALDALMTFADEEANALGIADYDHALGDALLVLQHLRDIMKAKGP